MEFTPEVADGTVELTYTLDASTLAGTTIVVFETLYSDGVEIAAHADINDEAQTITIEPQGWPAHPKDLRGRRAGGLHLLGGG